MTPVTMQELAGRLSKAKEQADAQLEELRAHPNAGRAFIEDRLRSYIAFKLLLTEDEISDNIIEMVRINVAKAAHMTIEELKEMDRPGACGSAPTVLSKRVLLFLAIQNTLDITLLIRGVLSIYAYLLDQRSLNEIMDTPLYFMEQTSINQQLSLGRFSVLSGLSGKVLEFCCEHAEKDRSQWRI